MLAESIRLQNKEMGHFALKRPRMKDQKSTSIRALIMKSLDNGAVVSRTIYANLYAAIRIAYGPGNGSTTFNLPDMRQRFPFGKIESKESRQRAENPDASKNDNE